MKPKILFAGRFPPPVHGAAIMNENYFSSPVVKKMFKVEKIRINYSRSVEDIGKYSVTKFFGSILALTRLLYLLTFFRPNLVYFEIAPNGMAFYRDSVFVIICKIFRRKIIFHLHARNLEKNRYSKFIFNKCKIIILSHHLFGEVLGLVNKPDVYILPNGIPDMTNEKEFAKIISERRKRKNLQIIFLSNMIEEKGALDALKACNLLKGKVNFKCKFIGQWKDLKFRDRWIKYLEENNLGDVCEYMGAKYGYEKKKLLSESDVMIFPTIYENESFPLVILEAFMFGTPVFTYNNGAIKEIVNNRDLGFVAKKGDFKTLAKEIMKMKNIRSREIRKSFLNKYSLEAASTKLVKIFEENI